MAPEFPRTWPQNSQEHGSRVPDNMAQEKMTRAPENTAQELQNPNKIVTNKNGIALKKQNKIIFCQCYKQHMIN
jgi:hypothetical protein